MAKKQIAVIGSGISGLAAAHRLLQLEKEQEDEYDITLFEARLRLGGVIRTETDQGRILEWGPENFVGFKPALVQMAQELGIEDRIIGSNDRVRHTFVASGGRLNSLPEGMAFLAPVSFRALWGSDYLSTRGKLRACLEPFMPVTRGEPTVAQFIRRRLGAEMCEKVASPLVSAIYGGDVHKLSMAAALPDSYEMEQKSGSLWRAMRRRNRASRGAQKPSKVPRTFFLSFRDGMRELVEALEESLMPRIHPLLGEKGIRLSHGKTLVVGNDHFEAPFDAVIVATPSAAASGIIRPLSAVVSGELSAIPYSSVTLLYLAYRRGEFSHPLNGFGFVTAADDAGVLDACTFVSSKFEGRCPEDQVLLRCAVHDGRFQRAWNSESELVDRVQGELKRLLGISCDPLFVGVRSLSRAMPQPVVGHRQRLHRIEKGLHQHPGLFLCGAYQAGVGLPDSAANGRMTALDVARYLNETHRERVGRNAHPWAISQGPFASTQLNGSKT